MEDCQPAEPEAEDTDMEDADSDEPAESLVNTKKKTIAKTMLNSQMVGMYPSGSISVPYGIAE